MVPYTIDAVTAIRHAAATKTSTSEIQQLLGWDTPMLERVCRKHGIDVVVPAEMPAPVVQPRAKPSPSVLRPIRNVAPYAPELACLISKLTTRQNQIFRVLQPLARDGQWFSADYVRHAVAGMGARAIGKSIIGLGRRLERMGTEYRVETKVGPGGGYRLVVKEAAQ